MKPVLSFPLSRLSEPYGTNPLLNIAKGVKEAFCSASPTPLSQRGGPLEWVREGVRSSIGCPPENPNAPTSGQYNTPEGKCPGVEYRVLINGSYQQRLPNGNYQTNTVTNAGGLSRVGPITNVRYADVDGTRTYRVDAGISGQSGYQQGVVVASVTGNNPPQTQAASYQVSIKPLNGQPDVCPNPVPTYPPSPSRDNPVGIPPIAIPPIIIIPIKPNFSIPVTIKPNFTINGTINFRVADSIDIQIGPEKVDIYINPTANIDLFPDAPSPGFDLPPGFPDEPNGNAGNDGGGADCPDVDLQPVIERLDDLLDCACDGDGDYEFINGPIASGNNGIISLPVDAYAVRLTLVDMPITPKKEWGGGNAPDVYYAGWTSMFAFGGNRTREPIDYQEKTFLVQPSTNAFSWTCRQFYSADVVVIRRVPVAS